MPFHSGEGFRVEFFFAFRRGFAVAEEDVEVADVVEAFVVFGVVRAEPRLERVFDARAQRGRSGFTAAAPLRAGQLGDDGRLSVGQGRTESLGESCEVQEEDFRPVGLVGFLCRHNQSTCNEISSNWLPFLRTEIFV